MSHATDVPEGEEYGDAEMNDRGRLTIPQELREQMHLDAGEEFTVLRDGNTIHLVRKLPELETISTDRSDEEWEGRAFHDAGEATFGGE